MTQNQRIRLRREELGLLDTDVANRIGISIAAYGDIEAYADELFDVVELRTVRALCAVLNLDVLDLIGTECEICSGRGNFSEELKLPRNVLVQNRRSVRGLSRAELAEAIGFEEVAIRQMESDPSFLDGWSVNLIKELSVLLDTPFQLLADVRCSKCRAPA